MSNSILITGATGKQGGATIKALLASQESSDFTIFALTRNPDSPSAQALATSSEKIKIIKGDMNDCSAIFEAAPTRIKSVFCVTMPSIGFGAKAGAEEGQGKALIDAALEHNVEHFVYTSVDRGKDSDNDPTNV